MARLLGIGIWFDERDLVAHFGERYGHCRDQVGMLLPFKKLPSPPESVEPQVSSE
jgi:hypothetical protein